jgi:hypothetical protein
MTSERTVGSSVSQDRPWFITHAAGDLDDNGVRSSFSLSSQTEQVGEHQRSE